MYAQDIKDYFKSSPAELFESVDSTARVKMCSLIDEGSVNGAFTIFGDSIHINKVNDNFMSFAYSNAEVQMRNTGSMLVVAKTYAGEDSELYFYDYDWKLKSLWVYGTHKSDMMPSDEEIFNALVVKPDTMSISDFESLKLYFDPLLVKAELSESDNELKLQPFCPMLTDEEKDKINTILKQKIFKWINKIFK